MKPIFRFLLLLLSSLALSIIGFNTLPADNLILDIMAENPGSKIFIVAIISCGYLILYYITTIIGAFVFSLFFKLSIKDKVCFDINKAQYYNKSCVALLIALHVFGIFILTRTSFVTYAIVFFVLGCAIVWLCVNLFKKQQGSTMNLAVAIIPQIIYLLGNIIYTYYYIY